MKEERVSNANGYLGSERATHPERRTCAKALRPGQARCVRGTARPVWLEQ